MIDFEVQPLSQAVWGKGGRSFVEYRDLGAVDATDGQIRFEHDRVVGSAAEMQTGWHCHHLDLQFVYVLRGWLRLKVQGMADMLINEGDALILPGGLPHDETSFSDDYEVLHILVPPKYDTEILGAPDSESRPAKTATLGLSAPPTGGSARWNVLCADVTNKYGLVAKEFRGSAGDDAVLLPQGHQFFFVVGGSAVLGGAKGKSQVSRADAALLPDDGVHSLEQMTHDFRALAIRIFKAARL